MDDYDLNKQNLNKLNIFINHNTSQKIPSHNIIKNNQMNALMLTYQNLSQV